MAGEGRSLEGDGRELRLQDIRDRLRQHVYLHYLSYAFFIKGAILVIAGISIFLIFIRTDLPNQIEREALWFASFSFSLVTLATWSRGAPFANWHANILDFVLPIAMGISESLLYFVLTPTKELPHDLWNTWYAIFFVHSALAAVLVWNRRHQARLKEYEQRSDLIKVVKRYQRWLFSDMCGSLFTASLAASMIWYPNHVRAFLAPYKLDPHLAIAGSLIVIAAFVLTKVGHQYRVLGRL
jgi:hypothetical protein